MSSIQERKFYRLLKLSYDLSLNVIRAFMETNVLTIHYANLDDFLNKNKHAIYHLWEQLQCCDCGSKKNQEKLKSVLNQKQIKLLLTETTHDNVKGHTLYRDRRIHQVCICRFKIVDNCSIKSLDITLLHCLLNNFAILKDDERTWLDKIKDIRNKLAHVTSIKEFGAGRLQKWWDELEGSILGLALKMPFTTYAVMVEDQIRLLKKADLDTEDVQQILIEIQNENGELMMTLWKSIQAQLEHDKTEILSETEILLQKFSIEQRVELQRFYDMILECSTKPIHETIYHGTEKIMLEIDNLIWLISCSKAVETTKSIVDAENADLEQSVANTPVRFITEHESDGQVQSNESTKENPLEQDDVCKVEWKIVTPGSWNADIIADKLNLLSATIKELIQIEFVKTGSLTIHTTMPIHLFNDRIVLRQAVTSFLNRILEINDIDTNEQSIIHVSLVMTEQYELQQTKYMDDEEVVCFRDYEDISAHIQLLLSDSSLCKVHKNQELIRFCGTHDILLCEVCENNSHQNCSGLISIEKAAASVSQSQAVSDLAHKIRNITEAMNSVIFNDKTNISSIERQVKWIKNIKDDYKKMIYAHIRQLEAKFLEEMDTLVDKYKSNSSCHRLEPKLNAIRKWEYEVNTIAQKYSTVDLLKIIRFFESEINGQEHLVKDLQQRLFSTSIFHFPSNIIDISETMPSFVSIQVIDTPFVSEYLFDSERENSVSLVSSFGVSNLLNVPDVQMVCCIDDGRILLANCLFPHLYLCKNDGSEVANIYLSESPIDMACYDLNRALVIVMNKGINLINLTTKTCEEFIIKDNLCSICSVNSVIWVGSLSKELLQINIEGEILQTISTYFPVPKICVSQIEGEVYCLSPGPVEISDHKSDVYVIFSAVNTKFLCSISKEYSDIAVDGDGEVFVIGGKSIIKTSNYKREQKNVIIEVNGFENPLRVRYNNKTQDTVILNNGGKTVDVYKLC